MRIKRAGYSIDFPSEFFYWLQQLVDSRPGSFNSVSDGLVINLRSGYTEGESPFHPIEIAFSSDGDELVISYFSSFVFVGHTYYDQELVVDFDLSLYRNSFQGCWLQPPIPISEYDKPLTDLFIQNTITYHNMGVFTDISYSTLF
ncbi:MAG: DUF2787 family protein [Magnetococcales bacterium]|nr:DUF2787 family protein [Magnetococcales bacterium]